MFIIFIFSSVQKIDSMLISNLFYLETYSEKLFSHSMKPDFHLLVKWKSFASNI